MRVVSSWSWDWLVLERSRPTATSAMMARTGPASRARTARTMGSSIDGELPALEHREISRTSLPNQTDRCTDVHSEFPKMPGRVRRDLSQGAGSLQRVQRNYGEAVCSAANAVNHTA